ncbi:hypothetical protein C5B85_18715 [Pseudoclavibacter sp. AY1F1]|uniref:hypothetical protein n=1 Tax=Pseudoclavibacter sp. AY1F1 TaxID=2080583 RepID=UPI000CE82C2E|nr:hypothetical protein [Pseudoclavibacter sp. AY1F1]PPF41719.1 hypothetical protein C5B85_18715 [Pseudoclavibacter sp. AY1F1]
MAHIAYEVWKPSPRSLAIVQLANSICAEYAAQGYDLTLRQLYYQFVARDYLPNSQRTYKQLGSTIDRARKAGLIDWAYIVDRTRNLMGLPVYDSPAALIDELEDSFHMDLWVGQEFRVEVWVEKEALAGVVSRAANSRGVDYFSCRGYVSQSELHSAALRHRQYERAGQSVVVIHLGDHDPSGIDMTRDMQERLRLFGARTLVRRIALNLDQIVQYEPPPNPAKLTDSRAKGYIRSFGASSWELDALNPDTLHKLIADAVDEHIDAHSYGSRAWQQKAHREQLAKVAANWDAVTDLLSRL